jgi:hypothetical protein
MQGFNTVLFDFMSQNRPWQLVLTIYIWDGATLCDTDAQDQAIIVQYELACVSDCFV